MKKQFLFILLLSIVSCKLAYAQTPTNAVQTPTPASTKAEKQEKLIEQINDLREKVASKVAELKLVEKRGVIGIVEEIAGSNRVTITDLSEKVRIIDIDELTEFSSPDAKGAFGISDIAKGNTLSIIGLYNKQSKRILARFVEVISPSVFITGMITDIDKANFTVSVLSESQITTIVDIENVTRTSIWTDEDGIAKSGFTKLQIGDRVHVVGYATKGQKNRIVGTRVLFLSGLPKNPKIIFPAASSDSEEKPATGSGTKVTPTL